MKASVETSVRAVRLALALGRSCRFGSVDDPTAKPRFPDKPAILACWHEYLLGVTLAARGEGLASLASQHADGEIITRAIAPLGFPMARGSSSRGGSAGFRGLLRAARAGRVIFLTVDGPRGPRHTCQPGVVRLAARTGHPIVPMALAATAGIRARSWDRFLVPAPGARIFVSFGEEIHLQRDAVADAALLERLETAIHREVARCEHVVREALSGHAYATRSVDAIHASPARTGWTRALNKRLEARVRAAWQRPTPPVDLRVAASVFAGVGTLRNGLYGAGVLATQRAPLPVVSVGGLTVGGSGKTPLVSEVTGWLLGAGHRPAILTRGYVDEMRLHRDLRPEAVVLGHPDRLAIAGRAAAAGATVAVLDDGFQHRRIARQLDILAIDRDALRRTNGRSLPAGPFRESIASGLRRADALVLVGREAWSDEVAEFVAEWVRAHGGERPVGSLALETGTPLRVRPGGADAPNVALTGIMKPNLFFDFIRAGDYDITREHALPDHGRPGAEWPDLLRTASAGGFVMTRKDYMRFGREIPDGIGVWVAPERLVWRTGESELAALILESVGRPA
jgi:tetraacyldisaccharide 4'-kinase